MFLKQLSKHFEVHINLVYASNMIYFKAAVRF